MSYKGESVLRSHFAQDLIARKALLKRNSRITSAVVWSLAGTVVAQGSHFLVAIIQARLLGQVQFGEIGMVNATVVMVGALSGLGLGLTTTKYVAEYRQVNPQQAGKVIGIAYLAAAISGLVTALAVLLLAPYIATDPLGAPHLTDALRLGALLLPLNTLNGVQTGVLAGLERFKGLALINGVSGLASIPVFAYFTAKFGLVGAVGAYVATAAFLCVIAQLYLRPQLRLAGLEVGVPRTLGDASFLWRFALPAVLTSVATQPFSWLARVLLANEPGGYAEVGLLAAAIAWSNVLLFLPRELSRPLVPVLSSLYGEGATNLTRRMVRASMVSSLLAGCLVALPLMLFSRFIMAAYGPSFEAGWPVLVVMVLGHSVGAVTLAAYYAMASAGQMWWQALATLLWGSALVGAAFFSASFGAIGLAVSYGFAYLVQLAVQLILMRRQGYI